MCIRDSPNVTVNVTGFENKKVESLSMHKSQLPGLSLGSEYGKNLLNRLRDSSGDFSFEYGESFRMIEARS